MALPKAFDKSLWVFHLNAGSCNGCDIEIVAALTPRYDVERFGIKLVGSPKHADVLLATGPVTRSVADRVKRTYLQTPSPKAVVVVGNCGSTTGVYHDTYNVVGPLGEFIKGIDPNAIIVYVPGCPARPEAIIFGVVKAWLALEKIRGNL
ncbi:MAG TPA: hydrogenase [Thermoplasmata archaeon]|nr:hydrogenase [Thermoplasmata archaeon]